MKIIANIQLKSSSAGGRENPVYSGYRPTFRLFSNRASDCVISVLKGDSINPGDQGEVEIKILHPQKLEGISKTDLFAITEGLKEVASGNIIDIRISKKV